jgi:hypothetical protein
MFWSQNIHFFYHYFFTVFGLNITKLIFGATTASIFVRTFFSVEDPKKLDFFRFWRGTCEKMWDKVRWGPALSKLHFETRCEMIWSACVMFRSDKCEYFNYYIAPRHFTSVFTSHHSHLITSSLSAAQHIITLHPISAQHSTSSHHITSHLSTAQHITHIHILSRPHYITMSSHHNNIHITSHYRTLLSSQRNTYHLFTRYAHKRSRRGVRWVSEMRCEARERE